MSGKSQILIKTEEGNLFVILRKFRTLLRILLSPLRRLVSFLRVLPRRGRMQRHYLLEIVRSPVDLGSVFQQEGSRFLLAKKRGQPQRRKTVQDRKS